jgi:proline dehydrogenase
MSILATRWTLPDLPSAVQRCKKRNSEGIRCSLALLGEHATDRQEAFRWVKENIACIRAIEINQLNATLALKLTAIGAIFDSEYSLQNALTIFGEAEKRHVELEIDMEGKGLVDVTLGTAIACVRKGYPVTLALQAYLKRTGKDLADVTSAGISVRIVKGAYHGDFENFQEVQQRFMTLIEELLPAGGAFSIATHDPEVLSWIKTRLREQKTRIELGFLMGLADESKEELAGQGWNIYEYIPFGEFSGAYIARRENYLTQLEELGRAPIP